MISQTLSPSFKPPFKSVAVSLLFTAILGPVGLLYSTFWGGFFMIFVSMVVFNSKLIFPGVLAWVICSIWGVGAVEKYNQSLIQLMTETAKQKNN